MRNQTALKRNVMIDEFRYCHIRHVSSVEVWMLFGCSFSSTITASWWVYTVLCVRWCWHTIAPCHFWRLQKLAIILKGVGMGEISAAFCALSTEEFAASVWNNPYVWFCLPNGSGHHRAILNGPSVTRAMKDDCGVCSRWRERILVLVIRITDF